jgi:hypothetical protein
MNGKTQYPRPLANTFQTPRSLVLCTTFAHQQLHLASWLEFISKSASKADSMRLNKHTWSVLRHHFVDGLSFDTVDDVVASPRDKMAVGIDVNIILIATLLYTLLEEFDTSAALYPTSKFGFQSLVFVSSITGIYSVESGY